MASKSMEDIADFIKNMKFKRKLFGGVDELSVIKQMEALQNEYRSVYDQQAAYYSALIDERDQLIRKLQNNESEK